MDKKFRLFAIAMLESHALSFCIGWLLLPVFADQLNALDESQLAQASC
jgi:hypothetical protein